MGLYKDIRNYNYVRSCFKLICKDKIMRRRYSPKMTRLGILYMWHKIPANTPDPYIDELIMGYLLPLDEALVAMNTDGIIRLDYSRRAEDERFYYYLIKVVPIFDTISLWYFIKLGGIGLFIWYLINKFELLQYKEDIMIFLKDFWENIKL